MNRSSSIAPGSPAPGAEGRSGTATEDAVAPTGHGRRRPSTDAVVAVLVGLLVALIAVRPAVDNDLWFHLRTARWMLDHHTWVGEDPFNHTRPGVVRVQTDWLAQLAYYGVWRISGLVGVALAVTATATASLLVLYRALPGTTRLRAGVIVLTAAASSIFWSARTQMVTFVGTALLVALLLHWRRAPERRYLWWLVPLFLVWVNGHGGVIYGVIILGAMLGGESIRWVLRRDPLPAPALRRLAAVTAACVAVLVVNPSGWRVYGLPFHQVASSTRFVQEYQPPSLDEAIAWPFFLLLALTIGLLAWRWRDADPTEVLWVLAGAAFALQFTRSVPFFAVLAAPAVARSLTAVTARGTTAGAATLGPVPDRRPADGPLLATVAVLAAVVALVAVTKVAPASTDERLAGEFPVGAVAWLEAEQPPRELFNTFDWGGFLMWEAPEYPVSIDGRTDVYDEYLEVYDETVRAQPGWQDELARESVSTVLLERGLPLEQALEASPDWRRAYRDDVAVVFTRRS